MLKIWTLDQTLASVGKRLGLSIRKVELAVIDASADPDSVEEAVAAVAFAALERHIAPAGKELSEA